MSTLRRHGLFLKGGAVAGWVALDADVLLKHTKTSTVRYTKNTTTDWDGYAYKDVNNQVNSEIKQTGGSNSHRTIGFYNKARVSAVIYRNYDYAMNWNSDQSLIDIWERGVKKYTEDPANNTDEHRIKKISGAAEYYINDVLKYTSLNNFTGSQFGGSVYTDGTYLDEIYYIL